MSRNDLGTQRACDLYRKAVAAGEDPGSVVRLLADREGVQRPAIWRRLRSGGVLPPYQPRVNGGSGRPIGGGVPGYTEARRRKAREERAQLNEVVASLARVDRDPCFLCGIRADVGCAHRAMIA